MNDFLEAQYEKVAFGITTMADAAKDDVAQRHRLLSRISYYFFNGPFLRFWIKKGYDPRKDPDSRMLKPRWEDICTFRAFPYKMQTSLQLFELVDDYIQSEINKPPSQASCTVSFVNLY
ncbi:hypothetical protein HN51_035810 [Arachis hypogaea]